MPPFQNQLAQIIAEFGRSTAGVPAAEQEKTVEIAVRTETINRTLDFFLARAATNPITHAKLDYKWDSKGLRLSQRYWPTVRMLLQSVNLVLRWRATATKIGWNSIEVEAWDGDAVRYEYEDQQIIVSQLDEQEPTHTSFFIAGKNNSLSSLQSPARRTAEAAISRYKPRPPPDHRRHTLRPRRRTRPRHRRLHQSPGRAPFTRRPTLREGRPARRVPRAPTRDRRRDTLAGRIPVAHQG